jgi:Sec-independent protein translocase protein TatA
MQPARDILATMWDSPMHLLIVLVLLVVVFFVPSWLAYRLGKKVGDATGYIRGFKEGQASKP